LHAISVPTVNQDLLRSPIRLALLAAALAAPMLPAQAERADRAKPMVVEADRSGVVDLQHQVLVYSGNVVISQGTLLMRADRVELRESGDGYRAASATGSPGKPVTWRQRRDGVDETVEGVADRIELDGQADTLRFVGNSAVRMLRGGTVAYEASGGTIVWDNATEVFRVEGGAASAVNPGGRVRAVLSPRVQAASAPSPAPASLVPSRAIEAPR
jgi:lipopolysaccharide export system protein LptA